MGRFTPYQGFWGSGVLGAVFLSWQVICAPKMKIWFFLNTHESFCARGLPSGASAAGFKQAMRVQEYVSPHYGKDEDGKLVMNHEKSRL